MAGVAIAWVGAGVMPAPFIGAGLMGGCVGAGMYVGARVHVGDGVAIAAAFDDA